MKNSPRSRWWLVVLLATVSAALVVVGLALRTEHVAPATAPAAQFTAAAPVVWAEAANAAAVKIAAGKMSPAASTDPRAARIELAGRVRVVAPNAHGEFPRVVVPAFSVIAVSVPFAGAQPGELLPVQSEDGALLLSDAASGAACVGEGREVPLSLKVAATDGLQRVTLRRGGETRVLKFWVGAEPPVLVRN